MHNVCRQCKHTNLGGNRYCTRCGARLEIPDRNCAHLHKLEGEDTSTIIELNQKENFIGRAKSNSIVLEDEKVSKQHAVIFQKNELYFIEDLHSKNGVFVNGLKIGKKTELMQGALIKIGSTFFRFDLLGRS